MSYTIITHQHKPDTKHKILVTISPDYSETEIRTLIKEGFSRDVSRRLQSSSPWSRHSDVMQGSHCLSGERWTDTGHPRTVQCYKADKRLAKHGDELSEVGCTVYTIVSYWRGQSS